MEELREKIWVALDVGDLQSAKNLIKQLAPHIGVFKIGMQLFTAVGPKIIEFIKMEGGKIFLDMKFHDIPNTIAGATRSSIQLEVDFFNIHTSGGSEMMQSAVDIIKNEASKVNISPPKILGVTVLTSLNEEILKRELNIQISLEDQVVHLAKLAQKCGLDGVIASPHEAKSIRKACGKSFFIVTPGIRPVWAHDKGDQKRVTTPQEAIKLGANAFVIGRPITKAVNPINAAIKTLKEIMEK